MAEKITVTCYAGYKADERPMSFKLGELTLTVTRIEDRWYDPDYDYFKVVVEDGTRHLLRRDLNLGSWELVPPRDEER